VPTVKDQGQERAYSSAVAVERAADLLFLMAERGEASLTDLAREIGSSGSAVHRILMALKKKGLVQQAGENGPYALSWSILALTQRLTAEADLRTISRAYMIVLRDHTEETVALNVRSGFQRVCIDRVEGTHEVRWHQEIGRVSPLYAGATGRALLAYFSAAELKLFFQTTKLRKVTPYTTVKRKDVVSELAVIRQQGYAIGSQDRTVGVAAIAVPIFDSGGRAQATLTVAGPAERCSPERLEHWVEPLIDAAGAISGLLADASLDSPQPPREALPEFSVAT
jgi:DNA-binding IclR family transcriptional regulator